MNPFARIKAGRSFAVCCISALLGAFVLTGCALEAGTGDDGHGEPASASAAVEGNAGSQAGAGGLILAHVTATTGSGSGSSAPSGTITDLGQTGGEDPQPSPWVGVDGINNETAPSDRAQLGTTVEHK